LSQGTSHNIPSKQTNKVKRKKEKQETDKRKKQAKSKGQKEQIKSERKQEKLIPWSIKCLGVISHIW
jgi:hypothetical protein